MDKVHSQVEIETALRNRPNCEEQSSTDIEFIEDIYHTVKAFLNHFQHQTPHFRQIKEIAKSMPMVLDQHVLKTVAETLLNQNTRAKILGKIAKSTLKGTQHLGDNEASESKMVNIAGLSDADVKKYLVTQGTNGQFTVTKVCSN